MDQLHVLPFSLNQQQLAIPLAEVVKVLPALLWTPLPGAPGSVDGVINIQGVPLVQINLARCFGWPAPPLQLWRPLLWLQLKRRQVLIPVDAVAPVFAVDGAVLLNNANPQINSKLLKGVICTDHGMLLIQDLELLLSDADESLLQAALAQAADLVQP
ncbi:chemotaxis protein CheW [Rheinheimera riviphila]|uniref:chemotaxis protein CheW n=1 Tax=Rheinheimera riviphila TaxID=1834037 RepID=UPI0013E3E86A|nr:chemotaxis protein CheW [Rheinheimera riviphila]